MHTTSAESPSRAAQLTDAPDVRKPYEAPRLVSLPLATVVAGASGKQLDTDGFGNMPV